MADKTYENMIKDIEEVLEDLNNKELSLENAVSKYKQGMKLVEQCSKKLDKVEKDLKIIEN